MDILGFFLLFHHKSYMMTAYGRHSSWMKVKHLLYKQAAEEENNGEKTTKMGTIIHI